MVTRYMIQKDLVNLIKGKVFLNKVVIMLVKVENEEATEFSMPSGKSILLIGFGLQKQKHKMQKIL